jgi:hypothetical protein
VRFTFIETFTARHDTAYSHSSLCSPFFHDLTGLTDLTGLQGLHRFGDLHATAADVGDTARGITQE